MKRVLVIIPSLDWATAGGAKSGGGSVVALNLLKELVKNSDIQLTIIQDSSSEIKEFEGATVINVEYKQENDTFKSLVQNFVDNNNFDIILCLTYDFIGQNYFLQCHSFLHRCRNVLFPFSLIKRILNNKKISFQKQQFTNYDNCLFFATSQIIKKDYCKNLKLNPDNVFVIPCGVENREKNENKFQQKITPVFGLVAGSSMNKGGIYSLFAFAILKLLKKKFKLIVVEKPKYKNSIILTCAKYLGIIDNVELYPYGQPLEEFYKQIDYILLPSKNEAFGLVVLEAMSFGVPPISASTAGAADIINSQNGFCFNRSFILSFVKTLNKAIHIYDNQYNSYKKMSQAAYETTSFYSWKAYCDRVLACFKK